MDSMPSCFVPEFFFARQAERQLRLCLTPALDDYPRDDTSVHIKNPEDNRVRPAKRIVADSVPHEWVGTCGDELGLTSNTRDGLVSMGTLGDISRRT